MADISVGQILLIAVNALLAVCGFVISLMIKRLYDSVDKLASRDMLIQEQVTSHREDVLKNYSSVSDLNELKSEVFKRFDRFEDTVMSAIRKIPST